ncbi:MAG: SDR family oxidoreductase [Deltaproteobacteria bacterium]|nr:SDR family oxidoreductase [Deltaproteobacteria bacterium]MBW2384538.1 SDR family oxidoreductase [Deltaproteobacteria bacterium]MBW2697186.1 SDR family oxidoreductase [Deltaproteobacteria bacterium]
MRGLDGTRIIVTGGGGGIGRRLSLRLAEEGARIAVLDLDGSAAEETGAAVRDAGGEARVHAVDITDFDAVGDAVSDLCADGGHIDGLVNNAGWDRAGPFLETDPELWRRIIAVNYEGPLNLCRHVLPRMQARGAGRVVNVSSDAGRVGSSGESVYAGCKAAIVAFGKSVARELAQDGICINSVCPGPTDTALFRDFAGEGEYGERLRAGLERAIPMRRLGQPDDVVGIVSFLLSEEARFITGQVISVSGGLTMHG